MEPGANIRSTERGFIIVHRGSQLIAEGTADRPITFSGIDDDNEGVEEWGGIAMLGFAPMYEGPRKPREETACFENQRTLVTI